MGANYSVKSIVNDPNQRTTSLVSAACTIMDNRKKRVDAVKRGYKDNDIFDHTMTDILKVLNHKLSKRNPSNDIYSMIPLAEQGNFKTLDSNSDEGKNNAAAEISAPLRLNSQTLNNRGDSDHIGILTENFMAPVLKKIQDTQSFNIPSAEELNGMVSDFIA